MVCRFLRYQKGRLYVTRVNVRDIYFINRFYRRGRENYHIKQDLCSVYYDRASIRRKMFGKFGFFYDFHENDVNLLY